MAGFPDDLATWPYLAPGAVAIAVLALVAVLLLARRVSALGRRVHRLTGDDGATAPAAASGRGPGTGRAARGAEGRRVTSAPLGFAAPDLAPGPIERDGVVPASPAAPPMPSWPSLGEPQGNASPDLAPVAPGDHATSSGPVAPVETGPRGDLAVAAVAALREVSLLGRQLELLDGLERREEDPDDLAVLFALDNLTMRLRRNAESVLVLAGKETRRRAREPLSVSDTVRTACSQVEDYERVTVTADADPVLQVVRVVPVAHLLAELVENAIRFSAPDTQVEVQVQVAHDGDGVAVTIADAGIGMDPATLADARARLGDAGTGGDAGGGRIGLLVAGRLAQRLGVTIELASAPAGSAGSTAVVRIPDRLLVGAVAPALAGTDLVPEPAGPSGLAPESPGASELASPEPALPELASPEPALPEPVPPGLAPSVPGTASGALPRRTSAAPFSPPISTDPVGPADRRLGADAPVELSGGPAARGDAAGPSGLAGPTGRIDPLLPPTFPVLDPGLSAGGEFVPQGAVPEAGALDLPRRGPSAAVPPPSTPAAAAVQQPDGWFQPNPTAGAAGPSGPTLRDEAFAEIGRLSGYHPSRAATGSAQPLERRTPQMVEEPVSANVGPASRDASAVKSRFSAFQSGRGRARRR